MTRIYPVILALMLAACSAENSAPPADGLLDAPIADGRWMVINYWATWCHPCREEIPELNAFASQYAATVAVYAVNFDGAQDDDLRVQANELGIDFALLTEDPATQLGYPRPIVLPTTVFINPAGNIVATLLGPQTVDSLAESLEADSEP
jgi:thiol-disulfide isomerase/thioredoxin